MISMNNVQLLGKITLPPKVRTLKSGMRVAELGLGIPESFKKQNGDWETRMHFVDVVLWDRQADFAEKNLHKGGGLLVQGSLQFDQWETKEGGKRNKVKVKAQRVQPVTLPDPAKRESAA